MTDELDTQPEIRRKSPTNFYLAVAAVVIATTVALGVAVYAIVYNNNSATQAQNLAEQIQDERRRSIRENCIAQNDRNRETLRTLDELIDKLPPARRKRARENSNGTKLLIEALVPHRNCARLVNRQAPG